MTALTDIDGVGQTKAEAISTNPRPNFTTAEEVAHASLTSMEDLGITPEVVLAAQELVEVDDLLTERFDFTCQYCGDYTTPDQVSLETHEDQCEENPNRLARYR